MDFSSASRDLDAAAEAAGIKPARYQGPQRPVRAPVQPTPSQSSKVQASPRPSAVPAAKKGPTTSPAPASTPARSQPRPKPASEPSPAPLPASARLSKLAELQSVIDTRLRPDLARATEAIEVLTREIGEWETLVKTAETFLGPAVAAANAKAGAAASAADAGGHKSPAVRVETQVDLGNGFFCAAVVPDARSLLVDVGLGFFAEMPPSEAAAFARARAQEQRVQRQKAVEAAAELSARIKVLMTGIDDLRAMG